LSFIGDPFDYDVFVSYAHAEVETNSPLIRQWSRHIAGRLRDLLATAFNVEAQTPESEIQVFFDDRLRSGQPLTQTLRETAQRSALLLVLMSPLYPKKAWCLDELEWFFERAAQDGRSTEHCTVLRIQPLKDSAWPRRLQDERGNPVVFHDLVDPTNELPIGLGLTNFVSEQLDKALINAFVETKGKLISLHKKLDARRRMFASVKQKPADRPVIYFDADPEDKDLWRSLKEDLKGVAVVRPSLLRASSDTDPLDRKRQKLRQDEFQLSDGLVLLHGHSGAWIERAVAMSYFDRRLLRQRYRDLPWAILDRVGKRPPVADDYDVPCVPAASNEWQRELLTVLGLPAPLSASAQ
jgi:hypothetical protein